MTETELTPGLSRLVEDAVRVAVNAGMQVLTAGLAGAGPPTRTPVSLAPGPAMFADIDPGWEFPTLIIGCTRVASHRYSLVLGIDKTGMRHRLAVVEGSTRNPRLVRGLLAGLVDHGLDVHRPVWCTLDGAPALTAAVRDTFHIPVIQGCQRRHCQNTRNRLPDELGAVVDRRMRAAYKTSETSADAEQTLLALAAELDLDHPAAAANLRTGLTETVEIVDWHVPHSLHRSLHAATAIRSMIITLRRALPDLNLRRPELVCQALISDRTLTGHLHRISGGEYMHVLNDALLSYGAEPRTILAPSGNGYAGAIEPRQLAVIT